MLFLDPGWEYRSWGLFLGALSMLRSMLEVEEREIGEVYSQVCGVGAVGVWKMNERKWKGHIGGREM